MIFHYLEISPDIIRPVIRIVLKRDKKFVVYFALIDSGADYCIFSIEVAKVLGIPLRPKRINLKGIAKEKVTGYLGNVEIGINGTSYDLTAIFADIGEFGHGILGQRGFFEHFDVSLSYRSREIVIKPALLES